MMTTRQNKEKENKLPSQNQITNFLMNTNSKVDLSNKFLPKLVGEDCDKKFWIISTDTRSDDNQGCQIAR